MMEAFVWAAIATGLLVMAFCILGLVAEAVERFLDWYERRQHGFGCCEQVGCPVCGGPSKDSTYSR